MTPYQPNYPETVLEVLNPPVKFRPDVVEAVKRFALSKPYRGTLEERMEKFLGLHGELCGIYSKQTRLTFADIDGGDSGGSYYRPATDTITVTGKLSVVTYLHEFAHALGRDERGAVRWSVNLFRLCFPRSFARCVAVGHVLRQLGPRRRQVEDTRREHDVDE
jgi:hypothetical protein